MPSMPFSLKHCTCPGLKSTKGDAVMLSKHWQDVSGQIRPSLTADNEIVVRLAPLQVMVIDELRGQEQVLHKQFMHRFSCYLKSVDQKLVLKGSYRQHSNDTRLHRRDQCLKSGNYLKLWWPRCIGQAVEPTSETSESVAIINWLQNDKSSFLKQHSTNVEQPEFCQHLWHFSCNTKHTAAAARLARLRRH